MTITENQICTFMVGGFYFGIEVQKIQEVIRFQEMTFVPLASEVVAGLINLRGEIVTAIDLKKRLGIESPPNENYRPMNIIVRSEDELVSLLVDRMDDIMELDEALFERPPETLQGPAKEVISGTYKLPSKLLLILDVEKTILIAHSEKS